MLGCINPEWIDTLAHIERHILIDRFLTNAFLLTTDITTFA